VTDDAAERRRWRAAFPYHWDADDLASRRELLRFAVYASGALFGSTAIIAALGLLRRPSTTTAPQSIARTSDVPEGTAVYFNYPESDTQAMLLHLPGGRFVAYSQRCTHLSCAVYYQTDRQRLYCPCHEGVFSPETGDPIAGPPQRRLEQITLIQDGDTLYATEIHP
jgi:Rieske Fe-S protein